MNIKCSCKSFLMQADVVIPGAYCIHSKGRRFRFDLFYAGEKSDIQNTRLKSFYPRALTQPLQTDPCKSRHQHQEIENQSLT